jgi:drug/metabolite transporter (DMT)-like permease
MSGAVWATVAGVGFGLFQSVNRQAVRGLDVWQSTFLQLAVSSVILLAGTLATQNLSELAHVPPLALAAFLGAGLLHFSVGWTLLNASQKRIGAARTSPLLATTPLFGSILAAVTFGEVPGIVTVLGMLLIIGGVYVTVGTGEPANPAVAASADAARGSEEATAAEGAASSGVVAGSEGAAAGGGRTRCGQSAVAGSEGAAASGPGAGSRWRGSLFGLGTAACWAVSPLLIREGLAGVPSPGLGVTISMVAATIPQGVVVALRRRRGLGEPPVWDALALKLAAGVLVGLSTWTRWEALALAPVAVVLALGLLSVPTVILVAPPLAGRAEEPITRRIVIGALLVVVGSLVLVIRA